MLFSSILIYSCNSNIPEKISNRVEQECRTNTDSCLITIKMQNVTDFKWDKFYYFNVGTSLEDIDITLGFHYPYWEDLSESLIFVLDKKIVYHEEYPMTNPSDKPKNGLTFNIPNKSYYTRQNAVFNVSRVIVNGVKYYTLMH